MSADKYPCIFSRQMATVVYIANDNIANEIHRFTIDYGKFILINNYSPKWRWLAVDIYRAAKRRGKYPTLATDTEVNSCFSIY